MHAYLTSFTHLYTDCKPCKVSAAQRGVQSFAQGHFEVQTGGGINPPAFRLVCGLLYLLSQDDLKTPMKRKKELINVA